MRAKKTRKSNIIIPVLMILTALFGGFVFYHLNEEIEIYSRSAAEADAFFGARASSTQPLFINSAAEAEPYQAYNHLEDALYFFEAPEGFAIISHSPAWNSSMLTQLYYELMQNEHGDEINFLYEIVVYPQEEENMLATFNQSTTAMSFFIQFPAFPDDFTVNFPQDIGSINLYGGDTKTTIESMAGSLSHEYGHLFTFYYMLRADENDRDSFAGTTYARMRQAIGYDLITSATPGRDYMQQRHRYLFEIAAEDYVQLMGSPTTRQVVDFVDVRQILNGAERPASVHGARNAFPQENMMIPLANEIPDLKEYFYSFINRRPRTPAEEQRTVALQIQHNSVQHHLESGFRTAVYYIITWNTPYRNAIYTLICYDPENYSGWGIPIKTVHPGQTTSAVIGEYVLEQGNQVISMDDGNAHGVKVFLVIAALPDGTYYTSEKLEYQF